MKSSTTRRRPAAIGAGAMADIAFLLLIFFLVATTILSDKGILVRLPAWENTPPVDILARNVFDVKINGYNELLVEGRPVQVAELRRLVREFALNPDRRADLAESPTRAVVSLQHDIGTRYGRYVEVYDELLAAYRDIWEETAQNLYGISYEQLPDNRRKAVRTSIPMIISEAEPTQWVQVE
ncbi:MAG: biopolymer transporter ExbD [Saprospiraceae bacterium]|nr:biopolymer transporter ExbD [Saprospiraceae bacterium]